MMDTFDISVMLTAIAFIAGSYSYALVARKRLRAARAADPVAKADKEPATRLVIQDYISVHSPKARAYSAKASIAHRERAKRIIAKSKPHIHV